MLPSEKKIQEIVNEAFPNQPEKVEEMMDGPNVEKFKNEILRQMGIMSDSVYNCPDREKVREAAANVKRMARCAEKLAYVQMEGIGEV